MNNVVGKMLIVMQLVFSILFMCFAGAVYTFQGEWRTHAEDLAGKLDTANRNVDDAIEARNRELAEKQAENDELRTQVATLTAKVAADADNVNQATRLLEAAQLERDKAVGDSEVATTEAAARVDEASVLNREVESLRVRISENVAALQKLENERLNLSGMLAEAKEKEELQLAENGRLKDLLRINKIDARAMIAGDIPAEKEKVDGFVERTLRTNSRNQELVEITIGSDDKIYEGLNIIVSRGSKYLGEARVIKVNPDSAVCIVDEDTRQGTIQRGDNVTTKL